MKAQTMKRHLLRGWILAGIFLWAGSAWADWSPEIVIWQLSDTSFFPGYLEAAMKVDSSERVHIVHRFGYVRDAAVHDGLRYVLLDNHGQILATQVISDTASEDGAGNQQIVFFGQDSLWIVWSGGRSSVPPTWSGFAVQAFDLNGNSLSPERIFEEPTYRGIGLAADVRQSDRAVALVYPQYANQGHWPGNLRAIVQLPNGERVIDTSMVWTCLLCDRPSAFFDFTDSLQIVWRENYYSDWNAIFAKRVATQVPFDSAHVGDHVELTPALSGNYHSEPLILPLDSTRLLLREYDGDFSSHQKLHILERASYDGLAYFDAGPPGGGEMGLEGDSVLGLAVYDPTLFQIHIKRFRLPDFQLLTDEIVGTRPSAFGAISCNGYAVSSSGERHLLMLVITSAHQAHLVYRYWRSDLSVSYPRIPVNDWSFEVSPNPFNSETKIRYDLLKPEQVKIAVYDLLGRQVETLLDQLEQTGRHEVNLQMPDAASGLYFVHIETPSLKKTQKIVMLK